MSFQTISELEAVKNTIYYKNEAFLKALNSIFIYILFAVPLESRVSTFVFHRAFSRKLDRRYMMVVNLKEESSGRNA